MTAPPVLTDKQREYIFNANRRWNIKSGAVRSGKSFVDVTAVIPKRIIERKGLSGLSVILGVTKSTIERNVLEPMREMYGDKRIGGIRQTDNIAKIFGEEVYCLGADKVSQVAKIQGASFKYVYGDEVAKWNPEVFDIVKSRMDKEYSCFDGSCNPESPTHWLKAFIDSDVDLYLQKYQLFDNPYLPDAFVDSLCKEYEGTVYYDRLILGEWKKAEGAVYPMFTRADHVVNAADLSFWQKKDRYVSVDYGTQNATVFLLWEPAKDGRWILTREYYHSGREESARVGPAGQKTDAQYADDLTVWLDDIMPKAIIVDPSAASFKTELRQRGYKVIDAHNDVLNGIRLTGSLLNTKRIAVDEGCTHFFDEIGGYSWDPRSSEDRPIKEADHVMDAMRYFCYTMLRPKRGGLKNFK